MNGLFITFEGPDGSGKSTQIKKVATYFDTIHRPYILTREPGGTAISDAIRHIILDPAYEGLKEEAEILLYAASRAQHVKEKIVPALEEGVTVLCDRFVDASIAYQGYGLGYPIDKIKDINTFATSGLTPNRSYIIDIEPEAARLRMTKRQTDEYGAGLDRIEQRHLDYHERVRKGFQTIYGENKQRICWINGDQSIEKVFDDILTDLNQFF